MAGCFLAIVGAGAGFVAGRFYEKSLVAPQEPLVAETEAPEPQPKPLEGQWKNADSGEVMTIEGTKVVHNDGKVEQIEDLANETLYTHRMSIRKGWFSEAPEVFGSHGKILDEKSIEWSDGRIWVKMDVARA